jgi:tRNA (cmo5U34)-methyltransferase
VSSDNVREHFEQEASYYDSLIPRLIPFYREQNALMLDLIPHQRSADLRALDLGAGTGVLSALILEAFPKATVVAYDIAESMLAACRANLSAYEGRIAFRLGDFGGGDLGGGYDLVVSGLAIHHVGDDEKRALFGRLYQAMNAGGCLLIRDIVKGATPALTAQYERLWRRYMASSGEDDERWYSKYLNEDKPASVEDQVAWLREAGFADVGCHWRHLNFAIFGGRKPAR